MRAKDSVYLFSVVNEAVKASTVIIKAVNIIEHMYTQSYTHSWA